MKHGKVVIYLLIISYLLNIGHNFIPHHHHQEDHKIFAHVHHHHNLPAEPIDNDEHDIICNIFSNISHQHEGECIVISSSEDFKRSFTIDYTFGIVTQIAIFENYLPLFKCKQPPEDNSYKKLHLHLSYGLRAPPVA